MRISGLAIYENGRQSGRPARRGARHRLAIELSGQADQDRGVCSPFGCLCDLT
jgi:hypothetical protein